MNQCSSDKPVKSSCCGPAPVVSSCQTGQLDPGQAIQSNASSSCCDTDGSRADYFFWTAMLIVVAGYILHMVIPDSHWMVASMSGAMYELMNTMAIGIVIGVMMVAVLSVVPREFVLSIFGTNTGVKGLVRATLAGLLLDLCSHGILMVGAKLYERGVSTGQVMAFLIASPWNSLSLTIILVSLIGLLWTLVFIVLSIMIALVTGWVFDALVKANKLPANPHTTSLPKDFHFAREMRAQLSNIKLDSRSIWNFFFNGLRESKMVIKWLFVGIILAALIRTFVPEDYFGTYFGPTLLGLAVTLLAATVIEVCSEGSTPIAADIFNRAHAPGNGFAFLMTGVSTDYTEIMVLKDTTKSWKTALFLPLITLPQIILLAMILNFV